MKTAESRQREILHAWEVPDHFTLEMFNRALSEMTNVYQPSSDGKKTIRELRASK